MSVDLLLQLRALPVSARRQRLSMRAERAACDNCVRLHAIEVDHTMGAAVNAATTHGHSSQEVHYRVFRNK
ncbi:MAG: hypothetical protein EXR27_01285 [Betaproteobacteria bacterium]|nr:hypothetical protein [Betaproteobacteria bacterium]